MRAKTLTKVFSAVGGLAGSGGSVPAILDAIGNEALGELLLDGAKLVKREDDEERDEGRFPLKFSTTKRGG